MMITFPYFLLFSFPCFAVQGVVSAMSVDQPIESDLSKVMNIYKNLRSERSLPSKYQLDARVRDQATIDAAVNTALGTINPTSTLDEFVENLALAALDGQALIDLLTSYFSQREQYENMASFSKYLFGIAA